MLTIEMKELFFDRPAVREAIDRGKRDALSKQGAFVRQRARSSIRKRERASNPGEPPSSHVGTLKRLILFAFDQATESVVVGPERLFFKPTTGGVPIPSLLEFGGRAVIRHVLRNQVRPTVAAWAGVGPRVEEVEAEIRPRPFMGPALEAEASELVNAWRGVVRDK